MTSDRRHNIRNTGAIREDLLLWTYLIRELVYRVHLWVYGQHSQTKRHNFKLLHRKTSLVQARA